MHAVRVTWEPWPGRPWPEMLDVGRYWRLLEEAFDLLFGLQPRLADTDTDEYIQLVEHLESVGHHAKTRRPTDAAILFRGVAYYHLERGLAEADVQTRQSHLRRSSQATIVADSLGGQTDIVIAETTRLADIRMKE